MKAIKFDGDINFESIKKLLEEIDKVSNDNIVLYINSMGGNTSDTTDLADYINRIKDKFEIVCSWEISSAALDLLLQVECKIKLINGMFSRVHLFSNKLDYYNLNDKDSIDRFLLAYLDRHNSEWLERLVKCGFDTKEIESIKLGNTLNCDTKRVKYIISILNPKAILV
jgi:hypothetical protein